MDNMTISTTDRGCLKAKFMSGKHAVRTQRWKNIIAIIDIAVTSQGSHSGT